MNRDQGDNNNSKSIVNAFSLLMANRYKQNELLKENTIDSSEEFCDSDSDASICSVKSFNLKGNNTFSNSSEVLGSKKNVFEYLMHNNERRRNSEQEDNLSYDFPSPSHKNRYKNKDIKFMFNSNKKLNNCNDSLEDFEVKIKDQNPQEVKIEDDNICELVPKEKFENKGLISPSDLKSKLINEIDGFDIEETFKEEIQECFSKSRKKRKKPKLKENIIKDIQNDAKEILLNDNVSDDDLFLKQENKTLKMDTNQPDIKSFFKPKNVGVFNNNNKEIFNLDPSKIIANPFVLSNEDSVLDERGKEETDLIKDSIGPPQNLKNRPSCLKLKTKLLREIRKKPGENKIKKGQVEPECKTGQNDSSGSDFTGQVKPDCKTGQNDSSGSDFTGQVEPDCKTGQNDSSNSDFTGQVELDCKTGQNNSSGSDFTGEEKDFKLRRSSRAVKKPKTYEIFEISSEYETPKIKNSLNPKPSNKAKRDKKSETRVTGPQLEVLDVNDGSSVVVKGEKSCGKKSERKKKSFFQKTSGSKPDTNVPDVITINESPEGQDKKSQLAPIFVKKKKLQISPSKLQARKDFFFSDVSEMLKRSSLKSAEEPSRICPFPEHSHVRQREASEPLWNLSNPLLSLNEEVEDTCYSLETFCHFINCSEEKSEHSEELLESFPIMDDLIMCHSLAYYKSKFKNFPVLSVFKSFLDSKRDFIMYFEKECSREVQKIEFKESAKKNKGKINTNTQVRSKRKKNNSSRKSKRRKISTREFSGDFSGDEIIAEQVWHKWIPYEWTQVFSPKSAEFLIGNIGPICKLKEFLIKWKSAFKSDINSANGSDSNMSGDSNFEPSVINAMLISGPSGVGKTAAVYALAQDLGYKVLEINASSPRQGKQLMSQLSEATQSHNVTSVGSNQSLLPGLSNQSVVDSINSLDKGRSMSLILIEDIDIVFEDLDEGFWNAVNTLLCTSKRPIIITTSLDVAFPIPKIKEKYDEVTFHTPNSELIAHYLQLMCLANGVFTSSKEIELLIKSNKNDIRKSILDLHFWVMSGKCTVAWWQINSESNFTTVLKEKKENDITLLEIFPEAIKYSNKCVKIPISSGSIWSKEDAKYLNTPNILGNNENQVLNWTLMSANCDSLFPFTTVEKIRHYKYPLKKDNPELKRHSLWQKHSWLSLDDENDSENESSIQPDIQENVGKKLPKKLSQCLETCTYSLNKFFSSFVDLDILSCGSYLSQKEFSREFHRNWWTPAIVDGLETGSVRSVSHYYHDYLNSVLVPKLSHLNLINATKQLNCAMNSKDMIDDAQMLTTLETSSNSFNMKPHSRLSLSEENKMEELNHILSSELAISTQLNRTSAVVDYIPYLREIARTDHVGEAIQKLKRTRRVIKHFHNLEIYSLSSSELLDLCNIFQTILE